MTRKKTWSKDTIRFSMHIPPQVMKRLLLLQKMLGATSIEETIERLMEFWATNMPGMMNAEPNWHPKASRREKP